jgi:hypothetical protein
MAGAAVFNRVLGVGVALGALLAGIAACGPDSGQLLGGGDDNGNNGSSNPNDNSGGWDSGATYSSDGAIEPLAAQLFDQIEPQLVTKCGGACHQTGQTLGAPIWLGATNEYATIKAYPGIVVSDVYSSKLENRPANHPAACLVDPGNEALLASVTTWLTAEAAALTAIPLPATAVVDPASGSVDLSSAGTGINGAKITFTATQDGDLLRFDNVMLVAPAAAGVHIISPIFAQMPASGPEVDNTDFSTTDLTAAAGASAQISPVFYFPGWTPGSQLKIEFQKIEASTATADAGSTTTCKDLTDFQNSAAVSMKANCVSCHGGGNPTAQSSMDLSALNTNDYATACTQARTQVNTTTPAQSNVLLAPLQQVNHPVKVFSSNTVTGYTQIQTWVNKE